MHDTLRAGIIGLGGMGRSHADAHERVDGTQLVAASELKPELADAFGEQRNDVRVSVYHCASDA